MLRVLAFGAATGAAVQAWRAWPPDGPVTIAPAVVCTVLAILAAYLGGRWHGRGRGAVASATAVAVASSEAAATGNVVNVAVLLGDQAGMTAGTTRAALDVESAPWLDAVPARPAITADDLDGLELGDLLDVTGQESQHELA